MFLFNKMIFFFKSETNTKKKKKKSPLFHPNTIDSETHFNKSTLKFL